jgi:3D (Asp-Asp-Asp) domain-containing protein
MEMLKEQFWTTANPIILIAKGFLLKKAAVKSCYGPNQKAILTKIMLTAIICVPACIFGVVYAKAGGQVISLGATILGSKPTMEQFGEWQTVRMRVTAYCPCPKCCGKYSDGQTACGHKIRPGDAFVAADSKYGFGTEMLVTGYNSGEPVKVLDRGGAIRGDRLDVFFNSHEEALEWGVKYLDVKVRRGP